MKTMVYLYLILTFSDGTKLIEGKGPAGPTYDDCIKYAAFVQYQEKVPRAKTVVKRETMCVTRPVPTP